MSRIGKKPVPILDGVKVSVAEREITVEGKLGKLQYRHRPEVSVAVDADRKAVVCSRSSDEREVRAYHGLTRALVRNMVIGVSEGFKLLGFITFVPARLTTAMTELYAQAPTNEGRPQTIAHLTTEQTEPWFILFSLPKWTARADFIEFVPAPALAASPAEKTGATTKRR